MSELPKISVVMAVYNGAASLQHCLDSYIAQTYPNKELILIDGGSTDGSVDILKANAEHIAYWVSEKDRGIYHAWNKGLEKVTGDWVCFIGSDDYWWADDVFEKMAPSLIDAYPPVRVVYGTIAVLDKSGQVLRYNGRPWEEAKNDFRHTQAIPHPGCMHHRTLFETHGHFDESLRIAGDYDLLLRELKDGDALFVPGVTTVGFRHGGVSNSPKAMSALLKELRGIYKKHGIVHSPLWPYSKVTFKMTVTAWTVRVVGDKGFRYAADGLRRLVGKPAIWSGE